MKRALQQTEVASLIRRARSRDEEALQQLYGILVRRFLPPALRFFRDEHEARTAVNEAFMKLQGQLVNGFAWRGERAFYAYFRTIVQNECHNLYRKNKERWDWEKGHLLVSASPKENSEVTIEYIDVVVGYDPEEEEALARRCEQLEKDLEDFLNRELTPQERRLAEAYRALAEIPGSFEWGANRKTAFVRGYLGLSRTAFYPAHTRFKRKMARFAVPRGWLHKERS
jgi:DNA-directed RNA polymerase specialized sigma24 family protein